MNAVVFQHILVVLLQFAPGMGLGQLGNEEELLPH